MFPELLECFAFVWFFIFYLANISQKVLEHFPRSSSLLILAKIFTPFDCLHSSWCNWSWIFSVICLNSGLKISSKFLSLYLGPFSCKVQILEKDGVCLFFSAVFCIFQRMTCKGVVIFHIFKLKKQLFAYEEKTCSSEQKFVKYHEAANFCVCREPYQ